MNFTDEFFNEEPSLHLTVRENQDGSAVATSALGHEWKGDSVQEALGAARREMEFGALKRELLEASKVPAWTKDPFWKGHIKT